MSWEETKAELLDGLDPARRAVMEKVLDNQKALFDACGASATRELNKVLHGSMFGAAPSFDIEALKKAAQRMEDLDRVGLYPFGKPRDS